LTKVLDKVEIDKPILFKEKMSSVWKDDLFNLDPSALRHDIEVTKIKRGKAIQE